MAGQDLRTLFGSNDRSVLGGEAFTDRRRQWDAVRSCLAEHTRRVARADFDVADLEAPRHNVLVFHGVGGIGKSTLSRTIEASLAQGGQRPAQWDAPVVPPARFLPVRIDLARSAAPDFERVVLSVRLAVAALGRPMPAFDLALRRYWEHNHPGESMEDHLRAGGLMRRFTAAAALPQQLQSALADVAQAIALPGTIGGALGQTVGVIVKALRERHRALRALAGCSRLADLLEAEPDLEALSYYPHLLAWDLAQLPAGSGGMPVVLLDTFEDVGDRTLRDRERLLQHLVWLMPNAFFVITGRNRLQWADRGLAGQLDRTGPTAWPGLGGTGARQDASTGERQVLLGDFSRQDCEDYLLRRLTRDGRPLIDAPIRRVIADLSHGLPLYLDLAVMRFLELRRSGEPRPEDFDHDFPALIARTLRDLTTDERHVLRCVSLFSAFSVPLATAAAGLDHDAAAQRLVERPFVRTSPSRALPHHMHDLIRSAVRHADDGSDDRWSAQDWRRAAQRAFQALEAHWRGDPRHDRGVLVSCLREGLLLARDNRLDLGWLSDAAFQYVSESIWEPLDLPAAPLPQPGTLRTAADALVETLSAIARRTHEHRERTAGRLSAVLAAGLLPVELTDLVLFHLAKAQRSIGQDEEARGNLRRVVARGGRFASGAARGLAQLSRRFGDFPTAVEAAGLLGRQGRGARVLGDIWTDQGDMSRAVTALRTARDEAEAHAAVGEAAKVQVRLALATAFTDPARADDELALAASLLARANLRSTAFTGRVAALVRDAGHIADVPDRAAVLLAEIDAAGIKSAAARLQLARCFHHAVLDDRDALAADLTALRSRTADGYFAHYVEIAHFMSALPRPDGLPEARWLDGVTVTRQRWRSLVLERRNILPPPS